MGRFSTSTGRVPSPWRTLALVVCTAVAMLIGVGLVLLVRGGDVEAGDESLAAAPPAAPRVSRGASMRSGPPRLSPPETVMADKAPRVPADEGPQASPAQKAQ
jgi:hypothetical protein